MKKLLVIGGGGHGRSVLDSVLRLNQYGKIGLIDRDENLTYQGIRVVGRDEDLPRLFKAGWTDAFAAIGSIGNTELRSGICRRLVEIGFELPSVIDPSAVIAEDACLGKGVFVGKRAVVNAASVIKDFAIVNSGAIIEHDCVVGSFAHISPGAILCGGVHVGNHAHVGAGSVVRQQIVIGNGALIGAGSVVVKDIVDGAIAYGNPCKAVK